VPPSIKLTGTDGYLLRDTTIYLHLVG